MGQLKKKNLSSHRVLEAANKSLDRLESYCQETVSPYSNGINDLNLIIEMGLKLVLTAASKLDSVNKLNFDKYESIISEIDKFRNVDKSESITLDYAQLKTLVHQLASVDASAKNLESVEKEEIREEHLPEVAICESPVKPDKTTQNQTYKLSKSYISSVKRVIGSCFEKKAGLKHVESRECLEVINCWMTARFSKIDKSHKFDQSNIPNYVASIVISYANNCDSQESKDKYLGDFSEWVSEVQDKKNHYTLPPEAGYVYLTYFDEVRHSHTFYGLKPEVLNIAQHIWNELWDCGLSGLSYLDCGRVNIPVDAIMSWADPKFKDYDFTKFSNTEWGTLVPECKNFSEKNGVSVLRPPLPNLDEKFSQDVRNDTLTRYHYLRNRDLEFTVPFIDNDVFWIRIQQYTNLLDEFWEKAYELKDSLFPETSISNYVWLGFEEGKFSKFLSIDLLLFIASESSSVQNLTSTLLKVNDLNDLKYTDALISRFVRTVYKFDEYDMH